MPLYAYYDHTAPQPTRVIGWYDTDAIDYPNPPPAADMLQLSADQWAARMERDWSVEAGGLVATPDPGIPCATPTQLATAALAAGLELVCTGNAQTGGTYGVGPDDISNIQAQMISIMDGQVFTNGQTTRDWLDQARHPHPFTITQFRAFARAAAVFVDGCKTVQMENAGVPPSNQATIP